eukprot:g38188.t1
MDLQGNTSKQNHRFFATTRHEDFLLVKAMSLWIGPVCTATAEGKENVMILCTKLHSMRAPGIEPGTAVGCPVCGERVFVPDLAIQDYMQTRRADPNEVDPIAVPWTGN